MSRIKLLLALLICCIQHDYAADVVAIKSTTDAQAETVISTKLTPTLAVEPEEKEAKSKTEKRDSADQTGNVYISKPTKETAFRPIYPTATYYEAAERAGPIFEPTTVRYTAADAAAASQSYFGKQPEGSSNIRFTAPNIVEHKHIASALPGPIQFIHHHHQQPQPQQQHHLLPQSHRFSYRGPSPVEFYQRALTKSAAAPQQPSPIFNYAELDSNVYERAAPQQYHLEAPTAGPHQQQQQPQLSLPLPGHRIQYIIAIPLSYMRQLQQQLGNGFLPVPTSSTSSPSSSTTTTTTTSTATPATAPAAAASQPIMQLLGPLARDHQGVYRPYYQTDAASAPTPTAAYGQQQYLQIPASVLLAAAQQLQLHQQQQPHQHQQQHFPTLYSKSALPTTTSVYQPLVYQPQSQSQPQLHLQRVYQPAPMIYAEQPMAQQTTLYAYPLHQQHYSQQQHQGRLLPLGLKQAQQQHKYGGAPTLTAPTASAPTTTAATSLGLPTATTTATHEPALQQHQQQQQQQQHHHHQTLPIVHYNPIYVQAPPEHQQQQQQQHHHQHQFAILPRFSNNNPKATYNLAHESASPIHVVRLSAANALGQQQPLPLHHYQPYQAVQQQQPPQQQQQHYYQPHVGSLSSYIEEPQHQQVQQQQQQQLQQQHSHSPVSPAIIPYFSHPGAVHYGTHLYHPASGTTASTATATSTKQQQQQQQQRQAAATTATSGRLSGDNGSTSGSVKQPTSAANIVKYP